MITNLTLVVSARQPYVTGSDPRPFVQRFGNVPAEHRPSLIVYTAVLVVSGATAIWYLLLNPRDWARRHWGPAGVRLQG